MDVPGVAYHGKDASCLKHEEGEAFDGIVSQGITSSDGDVMDFLKLLPQIFKMGLSGVQMVAMLAQLFSNSVHVMGHNWYGDA